MPDVDEGTLVVYHGASHIYRGDLAFVREVRAYEEGTKSYRLDTICYLDEGSVQEDDDRITTFGFVWAKRDEFTVVPIPALPEPPMRPGNYVLHTYPWRRSTDGSWHIWSGHLKDWEFSEPINDSEMKTAIYIGPLSN
jgi:hypothetical protein